MPTPAQPRPVHAELPRLTLLAAALAYSAFVVYGSLVPLEFRPLPAGEALQRFRDIAFLQLGIGSRADWVANLLLFVPLAFLWSGVLWARTGRRSPAATAALRLGAAVLVLLAGALLSLAIEFTQLFFPPRTVSQNDVFAECLGALAGVLLWRWRGEPLARWLEGWRGDHAPDNLAGRLLWAWLAGLFLYNLLPLDLTISPVEVFHKWREGRVVLVPFSAGPADLAGRLYELATDAAIWVPVALLAVLSGRRAPLPAWAWTVATAAVLEFLQVFVWSRVTDPTDVITAALGAGLGAALGRHLGGPVRNAPRDARTLPPRFWPGVLGALLWAGALLAVFWYPFDFRTDGAFLRERLALFERAPFHAYYYGTEFRAVTSLLQKVLWFLPLGLLLGLARASLPPGTARALFGLLALCALAGLPGLVELGQLALPGKNPDLTDWALASGAALAGFLALGRRRPHSLRPGARVLHDPPPGAEPPRGASGPVTAAPLLAPTNAPACGPVPAAPLLAQADHPARRPLGAPKPTPAQPATPPALDKAALVLLALLVLLPLRPGTGWELSVGAGYLAESAQRLYELYKPALLWLPLGTLAVFAGLGRALAPLALLACAVALVGGLVGTDGGLRGLLELAGIALGLWAGHWIGSRLQTGRPFQEPVAARAALTPSPTAHSPTPEGALSPSPTALSPTPETALTPSPTALSPTPETALTPSPMAHSPTPETTLTPSPTAHSPTPEGALSPSPTAYSPTPEGALTPSPTAHSPTPETAPPAPETPTPPPRACAPGASAAAIRPPSGPPALAWRTGGLLLIGLALAGAWELPRFGPALSLSLALYALALARWPGLWVVALPALLPTLDLAPWTGRIFLDEFDLVMLTSLGAVLWRGRACQPGPALAPAVRWVLAVFTASWLVSLLIGLLPLQPLDANAFASYWTHYNSLRVGRGLLWALVLCALLRLSLPQGIERARRHLAAGLVLGMAGVVAAGLLERWQYGDLWDPGVSYRIVSTFSSMHTGGGYIEAYLVASIPFLWVLLVGGRGWLPRVLALALLAPAAYVAVSTVSRAGVAALALALGLLACLLVLGGGTRPRRKGPTVAVLLMLAGIVAGSQGEYFQSRWSTVRADLSTRAQHWEAALRQMDPDLATRLFGMGLGRFPSSYLLANLGGSLPATYRFEQEQDGNLFLRLGAGETVYLGQRVSVEPGQVYRLALRARSLDGEGRLDVPLCEKHMLDSRECRWSEFRVPGDGRWHRLERSVETGQLGGGLTRLRPPTELFFHNPAPGTRIDVDEVSLLDADGRNLLANGDFGAGIDRWFPKANTHLPFHIKSLPVETMFNQGLLGLGALGALVLAALSAVWPAARGGQPFAMAVLAALAGLLVVGGFDSLVDAPRIALVLFTLLVLGSALAAEPSQRRAPAPRPRGATTRALGASAHA